MDFSTAILTCFSKYATFTGRARRSEFWWFVLFNLVVMAVLNFIDLGFGNPARWMMGEGRPSPVASLCWLAVILPSLAVGIGWVGYLARMVRASMLEVLEASHIRTARAFGLPEGQIVFRYALSIAILPTVTLLGIGVGQMLSSAVFAEIVFARPGIGKLVYDSILTRNFPVVTGAVLVTTAFFVFVNLIADLIVGGLDPRVRRSL